MANKRYQRNLGIMENLFWIETAISTCNEETQIASPMTELARRADALGARIAVHKIVIHNRCDRSRLEIGGWDRPSVVEEGNVQITRVRFFHVRQPLPSPCNRIFQKINRNFSKTFPLRI